MHTCFSKFVIILTWTLVPVDSGRSTVLPLYTIKKFDMNFNKVYFRDVTAFYLPVRGKWGRASVNVTVAKEIDSFWIDFNSFRQDQQIKNQFNPMALRFRVDACNVAKDGDNGPLFRFIDGLYPYVASFFHQCPIGVGTQMIVADRTIDSISRAALIPIIPSGYYKFTFDFRNDQNYSMGDIGVVFLFRGY